MKSTQCSVDTSYHNSEDSKREIFNWKICLWTFENEAELDIHNYLEQAIR